jgi:hypothetical protein
VLVPVPCRAGEPLCAYFDRPVTASEWQVHNLLGERVAALPLGSQPGHCVETRSFAPGVYLVRLKVYYADGGHETFIRKVAVVR